MEKKYFIEYEVKPSEDEESSSEEVEFTLDEALGTDLEEYIKQLDKVETFDKDELSSNFDTDFDNYEENEFLDSFTENLDKAEAVIHYFTGNGNPVDDGCTGAYEIILR